MTIELLIAFALFASLASSLLMLSRTAQDARAALADSLMLAGIASREVAAFAAGIAGYAAVASTTESGASLASRSYAVSPCLDAFLVIARKDLQSVARIARTNDAAASRARGGDCAYAEPVTDEGLTSDLSIEGEDGVALDVLGDYAVIGLASPPYAQIIDLERDANVTPENAFVLYAPVNAVDLVLIADEGGMRRYAFLALATTSRQFAVIDVTDARNPLLVASSSLPGVDPAGSFPQAFRLRYYDGTVYVAARETAGPELHAFDVSDPRHPVHLGSAAINITLNDMDIRAEDSKRFLYAASARDSSELAVFDVTDPVRMTEVAARRVDLPGAQDGRSVAILGDRAYLGRSSNTGGPEFVVLDISASMPTVVGSGEVSTHVTGIYPVGETAFLAATPDGRTGRRIEVWSTKDATPARASSYALPSLAPRGIDYDGASLYATRDRGLLLERLKPL